MGNGGEIFVFDMGKPVKILDVARQLIRLSGLEPDRDIKIEFTGLRPGEKLYEELFSDNEPKLPTYHPKINIAKVEPIDYTLILKKVDEILPHIYDLKGREIIEAMQEMIPRYVSRYELNGGVPG
jgi:FlaA1/EpsC-like NDP-sugar epimerase